MGTVTNWAQLEKLAVELSEAGHLVTQIHHTGATPDEWAHGDNGAHLYAFAESDCVITTDGTVHKV